MKNKFIQLVLGGKKYIHVGDKYRLSGVTLEVLILSGDFAEIRAKPGKAEFTWKPDIEDELTLDLRFNGVRFYFGIDGNGYFIKTMKSEKPS